MNLYFSRSLNKKIFSLFLTILITIQTTLANPNITSTSNKTLKISIEKYSQVKLNTCEILDLELELFKINLFYQLNSVQYSRKRYLTAHIAKGLNANLSLGGMIQSVIYNTADAAVSGHVSPTDPLGAIIPRMSGKIILMLGTLIDYGIEKHRNNVQTLNNVNLHQLDNRVFDLIAKIDRKLAIREVITKNIKDFLPNSGDIIDHETQVLNDLKNLGVLYWHNYHTRELQAFYTDRIYKGLLILKKGGGVGGSILRIVGAATYNPYITMPSNVITTCTGAASMRLPIFTQPLSRFRANKNKARIDNDLNLPGKNEELINLIAKFKADSKQLETDLNYKASNEDEISFISRVKLRDKIYQNFYFNTSEYEPAEVIDRNLFNPYTKQAKIVKTTIGFGRMQRGIFGVVAGTVFLHDQYNRLHMIGYSNIGYLSTSALRSLMWTKGAYKYFKNRNVIEGRINDFKGYLNNKLNNLDNFEILVNQMKSAKAISLNKDNSQG